MGLTSGEYTVDQVGRKKINVPRLLSPLFMIFVFVLMSYSRFRNVRGSHMAGSNLNFLTFLLLMSSSGRRGRSFGNFSSGSGSFGGGGFGGFGGGSFGGGGGGSW